MTHAVRVTGSVQDTGLIDINWAVAAGLIGIGAVVGSACVYWWLKITGLVGRPILRHDKSPACVNVKWIPSGHEGNQVHADGGVDPQPHITHDGNEKLDGQVHILRSLLAAIPDPIIVITQDQRVVLANRAAGSVLDFHPENHIDRPLSQIISDNGFIDPIQEALSSSGTAQKLQYEYSLHINGRKCTYDVTLAQIDLPIDLPHDDSRDGVMILLHDITQKKQLSDNKSDFVSNVSHELRTPLSSIKAYLEMLIDGEYQDETMRREFYEIVHTEADRLGRLIDTLLDIGRIETGLACIDHHRFDLFMIVHDVVEVIRPQAKSKHIDLVFDECETDRIEVNCDRDMIYQATMNLLSNAVKYTNRNGRIEIEITEGEPAGWVQVSITDTGVGIPTKDMPRIFDKCYRVQEHRKLAEGSGLGLNLVKQIIEVIHAGEVKATSKLGCGSTFTYRLPLAEKDIEAELINSGGKILHHAGR